MTLPLSLNELATIATGRTGSLLDRDLRERDRQLFDRIAGRRVLVVGGAGSIGAATVGVITAFGPSTLHVVDQNENSLAELVRDLRSRPQGLSVRDFRALPLDFGGEVMRRFIHEQDRYDYVLNFAALKHVRSEKDACSLLQMLDTNLLKPVRLLGWLHERGGTPAYFCVSTDKAANPVNLMGASKRLMEHVIFSPEAVPGPPLHTTSARFANVAFSEGSLLQGFLRRLDKRQPLACPRDTRRFFVSLEEAGQICLLAAACAPDRHLLIPRLEAQNDLHDLQSIAVTVLRRFGFEAAIYDDEDAARAGVRSDMQRGRYPLLLTPLDTTGEKSFEEFVGAGEQPVEVGLSGLLAVGYRPAPSGSVARFIKLLEELVTRADLAIDKSDLVSAVAAVIPEFHHHDSAKTLDSRM